MQTREQGLRRVAAVTVGLTAAGVLGSAAIATVAWASTHPATSTSSSTVSNTGTGTGTDSGTDTGSVSQTTDTPHATSGGT